MFQATSGRVAIQDPRPIKDSQKDFHSTISDKLLSNKPQIGEPGNIGLQLEFVENENQREIYILVTESNSSFSSLITVIFITIVLIHF